MGFSDGQLSIYIADVVSTSIKYLWEIFFCHLKNSVFDGQDGDVESSSTQIVNQNMSFTLNLKKIARMNG